MRSEKLNIKHNIISRLEVPVSAFCAAPSNQSLHGWVVNCDAIPARIVLRVNGAETPYERVERPDVQEGYDTVLVGQIFGFQTVTQLPAGVGEALIEVVAEFDAGESEVLLEARFPVLEADVTLPDVFADIGVLMKPEEFVFPQAPDFRGTIVLRPFDDGPLTPASRVLSQYSHLMVGAANKHALYLSIYDYAASHLTNIAVSQLDIARLQRDYLAAVSRWLEAAGDCVINGYATARLTFLLARVFPNARFIVDEPATPPDTSWAERWRHVRATLGNRLIAGAAEPARPTAGIPESVTRAEWPVYTDERPIFVIGAGRSGTSAATRILSQGEYPSFREGHVFPYFEQQRQILVEAWEPLERDAAAAGWKIPQQSVFERPLVEMVAVAARKNPKSIRWVDKTPDARMLEVLPHLRRLYPRAQYLFLRRHPLKLAESRRRKFHEPIETALAQWAKCERLWAKHKPSLPAGSWIECDQVDFSLRTGPTVRAIIEFLGPTPEQQSNMVRAARMDRPENTLRLGGEGISDRRDFIYRQLLDMLPVSLLAMKWPPGAIAFYDRECRALAEALGYSAEPSVDHIKRDIRDVSGEIFEAEEWLIERACRLASTPAGVLAAGRHFLGEVRSRLGIHKQ